jgi:ABC-2 type transport system permease protein
MRKILILARREYRTAVRTRGFIIGLIIAPVFMGGSLIVFAIFQDRVDVTDKNIVVIDRSGVIAESVKQAAEFRNEHEIYDTVKNEKTRPAYNIIIMEPDTADPSGQKLELSERVRDKTYHAFVDIGPDVIHPGDDPDGYRILYYSENAAIDEVRDWISWPINNRLRELRVADLNVRQEAVRDLFFWININGMGLIKVDRKTGDVVEARESNVGETIIVPYVMILLLFIMVMMSAVPLLSSVMEEKLERIAEVLLGTITPFQLMMGKILGSISVSLTASSVYIIAGIITATQMDVRHLVPYNVLPWFFAYLILDIVMIGSMMAALGSACNDSKDAQSLQFPAMLPVILPLFLMMPVLIEPLSPLSTGLSLFPPFTPALMLIRQVSPVTIPLWQPVVGLAGMAIFTLFTVWVAGRIFRTCILLQGQKPKLARLVRYAVKG